MARKRRRFTAEIKGRVALEALQGPNARQSERRHDLIAVPGRLQLCSLSRNSILVSTIHYIR